MEDADDGKIYTHYRLIISQQQAIHPSFYVGSKKTQNALLRGVEKDP
jgi:hypothetical protein